MINIDTENLHQLIIPITSLLIAAVVPTIAYKNYLDVPYSRAFVIALLCFLFNAVLTAFIGVSTPFGGLTVFFAVPLAIQLYRKWVLDMTTPEERQPNMEGVRAWLSPGNFICCVGIALLVSIGYKAPFFQYLLACLAIVLAYPLLNMLSYSYTRSKEQAEDITRARDKILQMLQEGKIDAAESRDLLEALGEKREEG